MKSATQDRYGPDGGGSDRTDSNSGRNPGHPNRPNRPKASTRVEKIFGFKHKKLSVFVVFTSPKRIKALTFFSSF